MGVNQLKLDVAKAYDTQSHDWYVYSRILSFHEQVGVSFCNHRQGRRVVNKMMGSIMIDGWWIWRNVIEYLWPGQEYVMENFRDLAIKLRRQRNKAQARQEAFREAWGISALRSPVYFGGPGEPWEYPGRS